MARIRTIKPEFPISESMGRVGREARLLYVNLWTVVDDEGRARGSSRMLASLLYPYDDDASLVMDGWLAELEREGCVRRYEVDGSNYIDLPNWLKHQKIDKPSRSRLPPFDENSRVVARPREDSPSDLVPRTLDQDLGSRTVDLLPAASQPQSKTSAKSSLSKKKTQTSIDDGWSPNGDDWTYATSIGFIGPAIERQALEFTDHAKRTDRRQADWSAAWRSWLRKAVDYDVKNKTRGIPNRNSSGGVYDDFLSGVDAHG